jgi:NADPH:quinone reductase-like Zn-dependent oxidoreductase
MTVVPGQKGTAGLEAVPGPDVQDGALLVRGIAIGICGTDREIAEGAHGTPPSGEARLIIGHESLGEVLEAPPGSGFAPGDLVHGSGASLVLTAWSGVAGCAGLVQDGLRAGAVRTGLASALSQDSQDVTPGGRAAVQLDSSTLLPAPADPTTTVSRCPAPEFSRSCSTGLVTSVAGNVVGRNFASANRAPREAPCSAAASSATPLRQSLP